MDSKPYYRQDIRTLTGVMPSNKRVRCWHNQSDVESGYFHTKITDTPLHNIVVYSELDYKYTFTRHSLCLLSFICFSFLDVVQKHFLSRKIVKFHTDESNVSGHLCLFIHVKRVRVLKTTSHTFKG